MANPQGGAVLHVDEYPIKLVACKRRHFQRVGYVKHINKAYIITGNPKREERGDYPMDALREIVINMIVHRNYRSL